VLCLKVHLLALLLDAPYGGENNNAPGFQFDLNSGNRGCARLGGEVALPPGVVKEEVAVLVVLVRRNCCAPGR